MTHFSQLIQKRDFSEGAPKREFDPEEIVIIKKQAYLDGYDKGRKESEAELRHILSGISESVKELLSAHYCTKQELLDKSLSYATCIAENVCEALFPKLSQAGAVDEIKAIIEKISQKLHEQSVYTLKCSPFVKEPLEQQLKELNLEIDLRVEADESFVGSDLLMTWSNGFLWRSEVELINQIKDILAGYKEINNG